MILRSQGSLFCYITSRLHFSIRKYLSSHHGVWICAQLVAIVCLHVTSKYDCLVGLVVVIATAEQEVLGSIPGSDTVLLGFSIWNFLYAVTKSGFVPG